MSERRYIVSVKFDATDQDNEKGFSKTLVDMGDVSEKDMLEMQSASIEMLGVLIEQQKGKSRD